MDTSNKILIEGHRGFRPLQNCEEGFNKCLELKPDGIETDLWMTKDENILVHHGISLFGLLELIEKKTKKTKRVFAKDLTSEDLRNYIDKSSGQPLLTLRQLFQIFESSPEIYLNLEIKDSRPECVKKILQVIRDESPANRIEISSFDHLVRPVVFEFAKELDLNRDFTFGFLARNSTELNQKFPFLGIKNATRNLKNSKRGNRGRIQ